MAELDIAMLAIFMLGAFGVHVEPWSPHPPVMVGAGLLYFAARIAVPIMICKLKQIWRYRNGKEKHRKEDSHGSRFHRSGHWRGRDVR